MSLSFQPIWSWPLVLLATAGLLAVVWLTYPKRVRHLPQLQRRLLLGLRTVAAILLGLAMFRPELQSSETESEQSVLFVVTDSSRSMTTPDGPGGITRREHLLRLIKQSEGQFAELGEDIDIRYREFDEELRVVEQLTGQAAGNQTAIGAALDKLLESAGNERVLGVILMSDGAQRATGLLQIDPRAVAETFGSLQIPIYTVGFGGSGVSESAVDVAIDELLVDRVVYEKTVVPITAQIRAVGAKDRRFGVRVFVEDRTNRRPGESGELVPAVPAGTSRPSVELTPSANNDTLQAELSFIPEVPGVYKIAVETDGLPGEIRKNNNRRETIIRVTKGGLRVAYFDQPRPEQRWIRKINQSDKIQVDFQVVAAQGAVRTDLDDRWFLPGRYDVYIIGDVPAQVFGTARLRSLGERINGGAGLIMTGGRFSFGPGGYAGSPIADLLPVEMSAREFQGLDRINPELYHTEPLKLVPTEDGLSHFVMSIDTPAKVRERWDSLSPLKGGSKLRPKRQGLVQILARTPEGIPLLVAHEPGRARVAAFAGDTTFQWWLLDEDPDAHLRFWNQIVLWLAHKDEDRDQAVWMRIDPKNYLPGSPATIEFGARDDAGQPVPDVEPALEIVDADGNRHTLEVRRDGDQFSARFDETKTPGDYWVYLNVRGVGGPVGVGTNSRFIVDSRDPELDNPAADPLLLAELASLSGGDHLQPEQLPERFQRWIDDGIGTVEVTRVQRMPLWDNWPMLGLFVAVMSVEWFIRKRRGLV